MILHKSNNNYPGHLSPPHSRSTLRPQDAKKFLLLKDFDGRLEKKGQNIPAD
jgi:hypothetical protein